MRFTLKSQFAIFALVALAGCDPIDDALGERAPSLDASCWSLAEELVVPGGDGTRLFMAVVTNDEEVASATWMTCSSGAYELYVNGRRIGRDVLKPGRADPAITRRSFTYDVTEAIDRSLGAVNCYAAEVTRGWGDGDRSLSFRAVLAFDSLDGDDSVHLVGTSVRDWRGAIGGPVVSSSVRGGETYDARIAMPSPEDFANMRECESVAPYAREIIPDEGAAATRRLDLVREPLCAWVSSSVTGRTDFARGEIVRERIYEGDVEMTLAPGETLVVDFGQDMLGVPGFAVAAPTGTVIVCRGGEALNDGLGARSRGCDGPEGSVRGVAASPVVTYVCGADDGEWSLYLPRFTVMAFRYLEVRSSAEAKMRFRAVPVSSVRAEDEQTKIEVSDPRLAKFVDNARVSLRSNAFYGMSSRAGGDVGDIETSCSLPASLALAELSTFWRAAAGDLSDASRPGALVDIVHAVWMHGGDKSVIVENYDAMAAAVRGEDLGADVRERGDWLSQEMFSQSGNRFGSAALWAGDGEARRYREFLADVAAWRTSEKMAELAAAIDLEADASEFSRLASSRRSLVMRNYFDGRGELAGELGSLDTASAIALSSGLVAGIARASTLAGIVGRLRDRNWASACGIVGDSVLLDALTASGRADIAWNVVLGDAPLSPLGSVAEGATSAWGDFGAYRSDVGFAYGPRANMNGLARSAVAAWLCRSAAGIAPLRPGYEMFALAPHPDSRLERLSVSIPTPRGEIASEWRYGRERNWLLPWRTDSVWTWSFTVPDSATALVTLPGSAEAVEYGSGRHTVVLPGDFQFGLR